MDRSAISTALLWAAALLVAPPGAARDAAAQEAPPAPGEGNLRVFLDCQEFHCDFDFFRREIEFVSWVRDRADADVHVLGTARRAGSGGREYTFDFIGLGEEARRTDTLRYVSDRTDTRTETREGLTRTVEIGLLPYLAGGPGVRRVRIGVEGGAPAGGAGSMTPEEDPWDYWVFELRGGGRFDGESRRSSASVNWQVEAERITPMYKVEFSVGGWYNEDHFEFDDGSSVTTIRRNFGSSAFAARSLGPHWSVGMWTSARVNTRVNHDLALRANPAVEYSLFPYAESSRRQFTVRYSVGPESFDYEKETIFNETSEVLASHSLDIGYEVRQPWGSARASVNADQFLHDLSKHRIDLRGGLDLRLFRGLSLDVGGSISRVKNQIYLTKEGLTDEEVLTNRRRLGTDFEYRANVGLSFEFGSRFSNVVNPRFDG